MTATTTERPPESRVVTDDGFRKTLARLSKLSVEKHFDAYADVDWDAPDMQVVPGDPGGSRRPATRSSPPTGTGRSTPRAGPATACIASPPR